MTNHPDCVRTRRWKMTSTARQGGEGDAGAGGAAKSSDDQEGEDEEADGDRRLGPGDRDEGVLAVGANGERDGAEQCAEGEGGELNAGEPGPAERSTEEA